MHFQVGSEGAGFKSQVLTSLHFRRQREQKGDREEEWGRGKTETHAERDRDNRRERERREEEVAGEGRRQRSLSGVLLLCRPVGPLGAGLRPPKGWQGALPAEGSPPAWEEAKGQAACTWRALCP